MKTGSERFQERNERRVFRTDTPLRDVDGPAEIGLGQGEALLRDVKRGQVGMVLGEVQVIGAFRIDADRDDAQVLFLRIGDAAASRVESRDELEVGYELDRLSAER